MQYSTALGMAVVALALLLIACSQENWEPKERPPGVPSDAIWAGGLDGGSYIRCAVDASRDVNVCMVWNDFTGSVAEKGEYRVLREHRAATKNEPSSNGPIEEGGSV